MFAIHGVSVEKLSAPIACLKISQDTKNAVPLNLWKYDFVHYATMGTIKLQSSMELQLSMAPGAGSSCSALIGSELETP